MLVPRILPRIIQSEVRITILFAALVLAACNSNNKKLGPLVAVASSITTTRPGLPILIDGRGSSAIEANVSWSIVEQPPGILAQLDAPDELATRFTAFEPGVYHIQLTIDRDGEFASDQLVILNDVDGDGVPPELDPDRDGDGVPNEQDAFPDNPSEFVDSNGNGLGNYADPDEDGDGIIDTLDAFPFDSSRSRYPEFEEVEFNDNIFDATAINAEGPPFRIKGTVSNHSDGDYYRFTAKKDRKWTAIITTTSADFVPKIALADVSGNRVLSPTLIPLTGITFAVRLSLIEDGEYYLIVHDAEFRGRARYNYVVEVVADEDGDGLDDDRELALGIHPDQDDVDRDQIIDALEIRRDLGTGEFINLDVDFDGLPNWVDFDSDADGLSDRVEGAIDVDGDTFANFIDIDADNNGIADAFEYGLDPNSPNDTNFDGKPDVFDVDDDGDKLLDIFDFDPSESKVRSSTIKPGIRLTKTLSSSNTIPVAGAVREESVVRVTMTDPSYHLHSGIVLALRAREGTNGERLINVQPIQVTPDGLDFVVPAGIWQELSLASPTWHTEFQQINTIAMNAPLLESRQRLSAIPGGIIRVRGADFENVVQAYVGGASSNIISVNPTEIELEVSQNAHDGFVELWSNDGHSIKQGFTALRWISIEPRLTPDIEFESSELRYLGSIAPEVDVSSGDSNRVLVSKQGYSIVNVFLERGGEIYPLYEAIAFSDEFSVQANAISTAASMVVAVLNMGRTGIKESLLRSFHAELIQRTELVELADAIESGLHTDIATMVKFNDEIDSSLQLALKTAAQILGRLEASAISKNENEPDSSTMARNLVNIVPPEQDDVVVEEIRGEGRVNIMNSTMCYLSPRFVEHGTGRVVQDHSSDFFGPYFISPQDPAVLKFTTEAPQRWRFGRGGTLELMTCGSLSTSSVVHDRRMILLRTVYQVVVLPIVEQLIGRLSPSAAKTLGWAITDYAITRSPNMIGLLLEGKLAEALQDLWKGVVADLRNCRVKQCGPLAQAILLDILTDEIIESLTRRLVPKLITRLNVVSNAISIVQLGIPIAMLFADVFSTNAQLQFEIKVPMSVTTIQPGVIHVANSDLDLTLHGTGLPGPTPEYPSLLTLVPQVTFTNPITKESRRVRAQSSLSGTKLEVVLPGDFRSRLSSELQVRLSYGQDTAEILVPVVEQKLEIQLVDPSSTFAGSSVKIYGGTFSQSNTENKVSLTMIDGRHLNLDVLRSEENLLEVLIPQGATSGTIQVDAFGLSSNTLQLHILDLEHLFVFGDNGNLTDDIFELHINGRFVKSMPSPMTRVEVEYPLIDGLHYAVLRGIAAPDEVGTYYLELPFGAEYLHGDPLTGTDLVAGAERIFIFRTGE